MTQLTRLLAVAAMFAPTAAVAQEVVTKVEVLIYVGKEDKAPVGQVELQVKYRKTELLDKEGIGAGKGWADNQLAETVEQKVTDGPAFKDGERLQLAAQLSDTRGKFNNCILKFVVKVTTDKGNVYKGETDYLCYDVEKGGKCKAGGVGQPKRKFDINLKKE